MSEINRDGVEVFYNQEKSFSLKELLAGHWRGKNKNPYFINLFHIDGDLQIITGKFGPYIDLKRFGVNEDWRKTKKTLRRKKKYYPKGRSRINRINSFEFKREIQDACGNLRCNDCVHGSCNNCKNQKDWAFHLRQESVHHSEIYDPLVGSISSDPDIQYYGYFC